VSDDSRELLLLAAGGLILLGMATTNRSQETGKGWVWPVPPIDVNAGANVVDPSTAIVVQYPALITQGMHPRHNGVDIMYARRAGAIDMQKWPPGVVDAHGAKQHRKYFAPDGVPIRSVADGRVRLVRFINGYGTWVMIDHGPEWTSSYSHLRDPMVKDKDIVRAGQPIGLMGHADLDAEKLRHLHFELWSKAANGRVDPRPIMDKWERGAAWTA
jgi:murein DD-endopeptidase MepM/ murein hydrolase activator NlpD